VGRSKAGGLPHPSLSPFPPLPLSIPPKFSDKPVGGNVRSSEGGVPRLPPYKYHPGDDDKQPYPIIRIITYSGSLPNVNLVFIVQTTLRPEKFLPSTTFNFNYLTHTHTHTCRDYRHRMNCLYLARTNHHSVTQIALSRRMRSNGQIVKGLHRVILIIRDGRLSAAAARDAICIT